MKYLYTLLSLAAVLFFSCGASNTHKNDITFNIEDEIVKNGNSLLWKIEKVGYKTSYIFGTMHMIEDVYYDFTPHMTQIIEGSDVIIMEVGGQPNPLEAFQMMTLKEGKVEDLFNKKELNDLVIFMDTKLDISPKEFHSVYSSMKPFLILQTITQSFFSADAVSYDLNIMQMAGERNIPIVGLESMEEQLGFFDEISEKDVAELIMSSVYNFEKEKKETEKLQKIYSKQKVDKLIPLMKDQSPEFMKFEDIFLTNRNKAWAPKIISETKNKSCFIAVGAAHLFDSNGVIELLKKEGFTLTAVKK